MVVNPYNLVLGSLVLAAALQVMSWCGDKTAVRWRLGCLVVAVVGLVYINLR